MATVSENMVIDTVDQRDMPIGKIRRNEVFKKARKLPRGSRSDL